MPKTVAVREVADDEILTQFGCKADLGQTREPPFRHHPRAFRAEPGLSVIGGTLTPRQAAELIRHLSYCVPGNDGVRYTTAGRLRDVGFQVNHTPSKRIPDHITVSVLLGWGDENDQLFDSCFDQPIWEQEVSDHE